MSSLENHLCHLVLQMRAELNEVREKLGIVDSVDTAWVWSEARKWRAICAGTLRL